MYEALPLIAVVLAAATVPFVLLLVGRRLVLARRHRRELELESRVRPRALELVGGDAPADLGEMEAAEGQALAAVLGRFSRLLDGDARSAIMTFFESTGLVDATMVELGARRPWRRARAARLLGDMGSARSVPSLVAALGDSHPDVRVAAVGALGRLRAVGAVEPLLEGVAAGTLPRPVVERTLLEIGEPALDALIERGIDRDLEVRRLTVELVARIGSPPHAPLLVAALSDHDHDIRAKAARGLGRLATGEGVAALRRALADPQPSVRAAAAVGLGSVGDRESVERLIVNAREDPYFAPARAAARAVAAIAPERLRGPLGADPGPHLREAADRLAAGV
jgi:HEAT repeat protein